MSRHYPFAEWRIRESVSGHEAITEKQLAFIHTLAEKKQEHLTEILLSMGAEVALEDCTKGGASYIIDCLLGKIVPIEDEIERCENELYRLRLKLSKIKEAEEENAN